MSNVFKARTFILEQTEQTADLTDDADTELCSIVTHRVEINKCCSNHLHKKLNTYLLLMLLLQQRVHHFLHHYPLVSHFILNMSLLFSPLYPYKYPGNWLDRVFSFLLFSHSTFSFCESNIWLEVIVTCFGLNRPDKAVDFKGGVLCLE